VVVHGLIEGLVISWSSRSGIVEGGQGVGVNLVEVRSRSRVNELRLSRGPLMTLEGKKG
jgi:hypothetical protein